MCFARAHAFLRAAFSLSTSFLVIGLAACSGGPPTLTTQAVPSTASHSNALSSKSILSDACTAAQHDLGVAPAELALVLGQTASFTACSEPAGTYHVSVIPAGVVIVPATFRASKSPDSVVHTALIPVTAQAAGNAVITVSLKNGWAATISVTVTDPAPPQRLANRGRRVRP